MPGAASDEGNTPIAVPHWRMGIMKPLEEATVAQGFTWNAVPIVLGLVSATEPSASWPLGNDAVDAQPIEGGLIGQMNWQWLRIEILAVPARYRGQGVGTQLMQFAEAIAWKQGCRKAWVDTFSFQAPRFYEKLGYQRFGELPDYPPGATRFFYWKHLTAPHEGETS